jgi:glutamate/aspartate transport system substrate-binding protein
MFDLTKKIAAVCLSTVSGFAAASAEDLGPTLEKIKKAGTITIGHRDNAVPLSYLDAQQKAAGFSIDLCGLVVDSIKQKLGLAELKVNYEAVTPANEVSLVHDGAVDLECGATRISAEVQQQAAVSLPIYASELKWIVPKRLRVETEGRRRRPEVRTASSVDDLRNKTVVLMQGSAAMPLVLTISSDRSLGLSILNAKDAAAGFKLVESGQASAFLEDSLTLLGLKASAKNPDAFGFLDDSYLGGAFYSLLMRKDDRPFKDLVDRAIVGAIRSGDHGNLYSKWFESPIPPKNVNLSYPMPLRLRQLIEQPSNQALANSQN